MEVDKVTDLRGEGEGVAATAAPRRLTSIMALGPARGQPPQQLFVANATLPLAEEGGLAPLRPPVWFMPPTGPHGRMQWQSYTIKCPISQQPCYNNGQTPPQHQNSSKPSAKQPSTSNNTAGTHQLGNTCSLLILLRHLRQDWTGFCSKVGNGKPQHLSSLDPAGQAKLQSQSGPFTSRACTTIP